MAKAGGLCGINYQVRPAFANTLNVGRKPPKMNLQQIIPDIKTLLIDTFQRIDHWFKKDAGLRTYKPKNGGWSIDQILEHIGLTNHFLLILIDKGTRKALEISKKQEWHLQIGTEVFHSEKLDEVGIHKSFNWIRPEHMEPKGEKPLVEVRTQLKDQVSHCLNYLEQLKNGEGILYKTTMSVNNLGKINVYEYIYFLAQHGKRHLLQMQLNESEYQT